MLVPATNETQRAFGVARTVCASCATVLRAEELTHALTILLGELAHALGVCASHVGNHGRCAAISSFHIIIVIVVLSSHCHTPLPYNIISTSHLLGLHDIPSRCLVCKHVTRRRPQRARGERLRMYPPRPRSGQRTNTRGGCCHPLADTGDTRRVRR